MPKLKDIAALKALEETCAQDRNQYEWTMTMCAGTACRACKCMPVSDAIEAELEKQGLSGKVNFRKTGCQGFCEQGPLIIVEPGNIFYCHVSPDDIEKVVTETIVNGGVVEELLNIDPVSGEHKQMMNDIPFYQKQNRLVLGQNEKVEPESIEDYIAIGGYSALAKALTT
ncbi:NAD(P)H-dependent oxidoreductase subunit E, partial [Candidatus Hydrogenedentota bacterium]